MRSRRKSWSGAGCSGLFPARTTMVCGPAARCPGSGREAASLEGGQSRGRSHTWSGRTHESSCAVNGVPSVPFAHHCGSLPGGLHGSVWAAATTARCQSAGAALRRGWRARWSFRRHRKTVSRALLYHAVSSFVQSRAPGSVPGSACGPGRVHAPGWPPRSAGCARRGAAGAARPGSSREGAQVRSLRAQACIPARRNRAASNQIIAPTKAQRSCISPSDPGIGCGRYHASLSPAEARE